MEKKPRGRPAFAPTDRDRSQVKMLSAMGLRHDEIALVMHITPPTLRKHFWPELQAGRPEATAKVANSLFKMATNPDKPNVIAAIFWLKAQAGWRDSESTGVGKKEEVEKHARTAHEGTEWSSLLRVK